jgi:hypothetical protein
VVTFAQPGRGPRWVAFIGSHASGSASYAIVRPRGPGGGPPGPPEFAAPVSTRSSSAIFLSSARSRSTACPFPRPAGASLKKYHAFGLIGTALSKNISVFQSSSLKVAPISPNASYAAASGVFKTSADFEESPARPG